MVRLLTHPLRLVQVVTWKIMENGHIISKTVYHILLQMILNSYKSNKLVKNPSTQYLRKVILNPT